MTIERVWLTPIEVCEALAISRETFDKWRARGVAPRCKKLPNGELRTHTDWLAAFMEADAA
jgi:predicted site-specific integrase-resolvase